METEVKGEHTYYKIVSPYGIESEKMSRNELEYCLEKGYFTIFLVVGDTGQIFQMRRLKIGKIYKCTEKTIVTEEELDIEAARHGVCI
jgi:hypothetical protein